MGVQGLYLTRNNHILKIRHYYILVGLGGYSGAEEAIHLNEPKSQGKFFILNILVGNSLDDNILIWILHSALLVFFETEPVICYSNKHNTL